MSHNSWNFGNGNSYYLGCKNCNSQFTYLFIFVFCNVHPGQCDSEWAVQVPLRWRLALELLWCGNCSFATWPALKLRSPITCDLSVSTRSLVCLIDIIYYIIYIRKRCCYPVKWLREMPKPFCVSSGQLSRLASASQQVVEQHRRQSVLVLVKGSRWNHTDQERHLQVQNQAHQHPHSPALLHSLEVFACSCLSTALPSCSCTEYEAIQCPSNQLSASHVHLLRQVSPSHLRFMRPIRLARALRGVRVMRLFRYVGALRTLLLWLRCTESDTGRSQIQWAPSPAGTSANAYFWHHHNHTPHSLRDHVKSILMYCYVLWHRQLCCIGNRTFSIIFALHCIAWFKGCVSGDSRISWRTCAAWFLLLLLGCVVLVESCPLRSIMSSIASLFWTIVLLVLLFYSFGVLLTQLVPLSMQGKCLSMSAAHSFHAFPRVSCTMLHNIYNQCTPESECSTF